MNDPHQDRLELTMAASQISEFYQLLQRGVVVPCRTGCPLGELLSDQWGIAADYVTERVTTVFLDHRAIDDVSTAMVRAGATIALSGAMPGLVGATMRRGGYYAAMRGAMTHQQDVGDGDNQEAWVRLKLFNLLLPELGPAFLRRGMRMNGTELADFLRSKPDGFWQGCSAIVWNGLTVDTGRLMLYNGLNGSSSVFLTVTCEDNP